jgi:hypothetical protein
VQVLRRGRSRDSQSGLLATTAEVKLELIIEALEMADDSVSS